MLYHNPFALDHFNQALVVKYIVQLDTFDIFFPCFLYLQYELFISKMWTWSDACGTGFMQWKLTLIYWFIFKFNFQPALALGRRGYVRPHLGLCTVSTSNYVLCMLNFYKQQCVNQRENPTWVMQNIVFLLSRTWLLLDYHFCIFIFLKHYRHPYCSQKSMDCSASSGSPWFQKR